MPVSYGSRQAGVINGAAVPTNIRSNSAIDLQAANRAVRNIRGGYVAPLRKFLKKVIIEQVVYRYPFFF